MAQRRVNGGRSSPGIGFSGSYLRRSFWRRNLDIVLFTGFILTVAALAIGASVFFWPK